MKKKIITSLIASSLLLSTLSVTIVACTHNKQTKDPNQKFDNSINQKDKYKGNDNLPIVNKPINTNPLKDDIKNTLNQKDKYKGNDNLPIVNKPINTNPLKDDIKNTLIPANESINYLAIGDSISAGFDGNIGYDTRGWMDENRKIHGLSFPSFLANYINQISPNRISGFNNLAITGSKITDWIYMLEAKDNKYLKKRRQWFKTRNKFDQDPNTPYKNSLYAYFKDFGYNGRNYQSVDKSQFDGFIQAIKNANLMTFTLGFNDYASADNEQKMVNYAKEKNLKNKQKILDEIIKEYKAKATQIEKNLQKLVALLHQINPKLNINVIGYPIVYLRFQHLINEFAPVKGTTIWEEVLKILNNAIKKAAKKSKVNYLAINDYDDWMKYNNLFAQPMYDFHPTEFGNKKIAQDLVLKMGLKPDYSKPDYFPSSLVNSWDKKYLAKDSNSFVYQIGFSKSNEELVKDVLGEQSNPSLFEYNQLQNDPYIRSWFKKENNAWTFVQSFLVRKAEWILKIALSNYESNAQETETDLYFKSWSKPKSKNIDTKTLADIFKHQRYVYDTLLAIQKDFDDNNYDNNELEGTQIINLKLFRSLLKKHFLSDENIYRAILAIMNYRKVSVQNKKQLIQQLFDYLIDYDQLITEIRSDINLNYKYPIITQVYRQLNLPKTKNWTKQFVKSFVDWLFNDNSIYFNKSSLSSLMLDFAKNKGYLKQND